MKVLLVIAVYGSQSHSSPPKNRIQNRRSETQNMKPKPDNQMILNDVVLRSLITNDFER